MSSNFVRLLLKGFKIIFANDIRYKNNNEMQTKLAVSLFTVGSFFHSAYAFGTAKTEKSIIVKKYKIVRNGFTEFMVIDEQGKHYNVNNSFWYWKWDSIEDWSDIKEGDELHFKYYGWRVPVLGLFPNIYLSKHSNFFYYPKTIIVPRHLPAYYNDD